MTNRPHILHVFPSFEIGGAQRRTASLLKSGLERLDHTIIALDGNYQAKALWAGSPNTVIFSKDIHFPKTSMHRAIRAARIHLKRIKPHLMITYNWGSVEWNLANSFLPICPMFHIQDGFAKEEQDIEISRRKILRKLMYNQCDKVIVPSKSLYKIAQKSWHVPSKNLIHIANGIDIHQFQNSADKNLIKKWGIKQDDFIIGTIAALRPEKNQMGLIHAFKTFLDSLQLDPPQSSLQRNIKTKKQVKLVIVGDGSEMTNLNQLTKALNMNEHIVFTGAIEKPEKILPIFDIFALSSKTEQMPISVIEAMAVSIPVIAPNVGDIQTMVSSENASLITSSSPNALARNFKLLFENPEMATAIGKVNYKKAATTYTFRNMLNAYEQYIWAALSG
jgi:glycosyltransferase involved in cell wall biosynthesis